MKKIHKDFTTPYSESSLFRYFSIFYEDKYQSAIELFNQVIRMSTNTKKRNTKSLLDVVNLLNDCDLFENRSSNSKW